jgi:hypothetical protein
VGREAGVGALRHAGRFGSVVTVETLRILKISSRAQLNNF